jgi:ligand-binding sensor domain-containing protein/signal transduction histidine kinase
MVRRLLTVGFLASLSLAQQLPIQTYTVADGLAEGRVNRIVVDSRGYVWIATSGGLSRFDGYQMKTYGIEDGLPSRLVNSLLETPSGAYLIGCGRGLCRLENHGARPFTEYRLAQQATSVEALLMESSGRILAGSQAGIFDVSNGMQVRRLPLDEDVGTKVEAMARDHQGNLWISSINALGILGPQGELAIFRPGRDLPPTLGHAVAMVEQPPGRMWAATNLGLALFQHRDGAQWRFNRIFTVADGLAGNDVLAMETDDEGRLWLGTSQGISRFAPQDSLPPRFENLGRAQGLSDRRVTALARDSGGNMWVGTENAGVMRIARNGFVTYREEDGLASERVLQVLEDRDGEILTVSDNLSNRRTIGIFDGVGFRSFFPPAFANGTWGWQHILLQSKSGEWWVGVPHELLHFAAMKGAGLASAAEPVRYGQDDVYHLFEDSRGGIWASANPKPGPELVRWDVRSQALSWFCADGTTARRPCVFGALVTAMTEDLGHNIWLGLWSGGLMRYAEGRFMHLAQPQGIGPGIVTSLLTDHRGRLWIAAGGGLGLLAVPTAPDPHFDVNNRARGLSGSSISCMVEDARGALYLGTARGVDRLDPESGNVRHFSAHDGAPLGGCTSAIQDRTGALWFSSHRGVSRLIPGPASAPEPLKVLLTGLQAGGEIYPVSQFGESRIGGLRLSPARNRIQVEFVAPNLEFGEDLRYKFKLAEADSSWSEPRAVHGVDYRNLAAGTYQFSVKAVDPEGRESSNTAEVNFTILPPLWQRWWFELCLFCAVMAGAYGLQAYRIKHIVAMERIRTSIATDLHDDIGTSLAQIAVWSEVARIENAGNEAPSAQAPMARIGNLAREMTDSMNDIVWSIRSGDESLESLTRRMREFLEEFIQPAGIDFSWNVSAPPSGLKLTLNSRRQIFLIYKECMHNVLKHSGCRNVFVTFEVRDGEVVLAVDDDGTGFDPNHPPGSRGNGLSNMRLRAQSLGGSVEFGNRPGGGCRIAARLPVRKRSFRDAVL